MTDARRAVRLLAALAALPVVLALLAPAAAAKPPQNHDSISYRGWTTTADFASGSYAGTQPAGVGNGAITFGTSAGTIDYDDPFDTGTQSTTYDYGSWTSPTFATGFGLTELVASWTADTPAGTWVQVEMSGHTTAGSSTKWYVMGRWASQAPSESTGDIHRTSLGGQGDTNGTIAIDTFLAAKGVTLTDYRLRVTLYRKHGTTAAPTVRSVGAVASALPDDKSVPAGPLGGAEGITLSVPQYSQEVHKGEYPEFDNGGEAWCSPTSTEMIVEYWGAGPTAAQTADIPFADPSVDYAAMHTFDWNYSGAGNWPFNIAYAGSFGLEGQVVQLRSLTEAEQFVKAGIPLVVSVSFKKSQLDGAGYSTNGHLMVIKGFTSTGDVVVNDPASRLIPSNTAVENVFDRQQFADVWLPTSRSGGIAYVIHPAGTPLPPNVAGLPANW
jgi:Peptidase_C39 like family